LKHTSVINVRVSPIFVKQEELISRAGSFCGFGKVGAKFAGNWIHWRSKVEMKVFRWNSWKFIESTHLCWNCLMFLWSSCLRGSSRWNLGLKGGIWMIFSVSRFSWFLFSFLSLPNFFKKF
jgi:hypothetical protein